ncbi:single-stranded DNA-binding protein [Bacillus thuringiensis]|uniref:single-stranded DNA-binding protein n=1 Tax=Bacillus thuringiensis TaxID=1428 RepID=UPI000BFBBCAD|nr:single-stranded DNA-binding protein [Bacillus thuringiensis]PGT89860.1 single-stranded DNA-binding protein [Bacillus thuringiensis]
MMNRVILVGRLTKDPDLNYTSNGTAVCTVPIAVNRTYGNRDEADFFNIVVWRKQAENLANYMRKGGLIGVDGRLQTRKYDGRDGKPVYVTEVNAEFITFLSKVSNNQQPQPAGQWSGQNQGQGSQFGGGSQFNGGSQFGSQQGTSRKFGDDPFSHAGQPIDISDDDLPF